ncbi:MAG: type II secretion system protein [Candidatus Omnitrophica bacterium]|nr:type II secretion system protein [Candidatus Omnitrophota bacterium]
MIADRKSFTIVELIIVMGIIGLLVAITIPYLLRVRLNANEGAAKAAIRTIRTVVETYRANQNPPTYPPNLQALASANPPYIDNRLGSGTCQGYSYNYVLTNATQYNCTATPVTPGITGNNAYYVDETGVIRYTSSAGQPIE